MTTRTLDQMTFEDATYIIRRKPTNERERALVDQAIRTLEEEGEDFDDVEGYAQRRLSWDEAQVFHRARVARAY